MCQPARSGGQNVKCQSKWRPPWNLVILDFYVIENLVQSLYLNYLNNCLIPDTYFCILKLLDLQNIAQLKRKRKLIMGAEFITFDNAVNAMPLLCRVLYEGAAYMAVLKNFLCLFCYLRIIRRADYQVEITVGYIGIHCMYLFTYVVTTCSILLATSTQLHR